MFSPSSLNQISDNRCQSVGRVKEMCGDLHPREFQGYYPREFQGWAMKYVYANFLSNYNNNSKFHF